MLLVTAALMWFVAPLASQDTAALDRPGQQAEGRLSASTAATFALSLERGAFAGGVVEPDAGTVVATLLAPDGTPIRTFTDDATRVVEFSFVAESTGLYRLEVRSRDGNATRIVVRLEQVQRLDAGRPLVQTPVQSPRLERLRREAAADPAVLTRFWSEIGASGSPLVEAIDEQRFLVTFLWRHAPDTRTVRLFWSVPAVRSGDDDFERLPGTDVWFRTVAAPRGSRLSYQIAPNVPVTTGPRSLRRRALLAVAQADPLNPRRWPDDPGLDRFAVSSVVELPGALSQPWSDARPPSASMPTVTTHRIVSAVLGNERDVTVVVPSGQAVSTDAALVVLFDRGPMLERIRVPDIAANLTAAGRLPPMVVVLVGHPTSESRGLELPPNPAFARFLATELVPWVRATYPVTRDPARTVVGGVSYGGIAATYAALSHPDVFGAVLCQSGSFWWSPTQDPARQASFDQRSEPNWLAREIAARPRAPVRFYLEAGLFEVASEILPMTRHVRDVLKARGYDVIYREVAGGHDYLSWRGGLADGLLALLGDSSAR